ncbi:hypothetical protein ACX3OY_04035 [Citrobacter farmeri]|uniref:hypothetical protein n=1 Tax=Citrobacter farmeri TaxID=67824 RepID=UPI0025A88FB6|nr:hypothetical protein [Citrobacter farmeri]HCB2205256.1 hypothetical protein [Citrobacter farmeri]HEM8560589.1 hypothetical protein [Citrobacter farmeri]
MSTRYTVEITASDGHSARLKIDISFLPGQSEWTSEQPDVFSIDKGPMLNDFQLMGLGVTPVAFLTDFPDQSNGKGGKNDPGGTFPQGELDWAIVSQE